LISVDKNLTVPWSPDAIDRPLRKLLLKKFEETSLALKEEEGHKGKY